MTQAFNLSQFANKVNTSGQADLATAVTGTLPVANGGTGAATLTANNVVLGNGTSAVQFVAPSTNGNILTSNGTTWTSAAAPASGGMTLLGTITTTAANSLSLTGLTLTSYKALYIGMGNFDTGGDIYFSSTNVQSGGGIHNASGGSGTGGGGAWIDLTNGGFLGTFSTNSLPNFGGNWAGGTTNITTASTAVYIRNGATNTFTAGGTIKIYGVK
jgi:hypothetical protein